MNARKRQLLRLYSRCPAPHLAGKYAMKTGYARFGNPTCFVTMTARRTLAG